MKTEIEVKFLSINHDAIRKQLKAAGAVLEAPMRLMRRVIIDTDEMKSKDAYIRVRDEGDRVTLTYKQFDSLSIDGAKEIELQVNDFQDSIELFAAAGLAVNSYQETKRETWKLDDAEIVLDLWPWLNPYIEIEGEDEQVLRRVAQKLGLDWDKAVFGDVMVVYRAQYPNLGMHDNIGDISRVTFDGPLPNILK